MLTKIQENGRESKLYELYQLQYYNFLDPFWNYSKVYLDHVGYGFDPDDHQWLANSNNTLGRAIFYLEVSSVFNTAIYFSSEKANWLEVIGSAIKPTIHERLVKFVDKEIKKALPNFLNNLPLEIETPVPPIVELIIKTAKKNRCRFSDAAIAVREMGSAKDYRKFITKLNSSLSKGRGGFIETAEIIKDLKLAISEWVNYLDLDLELTRRRRRIKIEKLPFIGKLLAFCNLTDVEVKDYILSPAPGYLAFIASWYGWRNKG